MLEGVEETHVGEQARGAGRQDPERIDGRGRGRADIERQRERDDGPSDDLRPQDRAKGAHVARAALDGDVGERPRGARAKTQHDADEHGARE